MGAFMKNNLHVAFLFALAAPHWVRSQLKAGILGILRPVLQVWADDHGCMENMSQLLMQNLWSFL